MITVQEASQIILAHTSPWPTESVGLEQATGRVLAETLRADRDFPPFDRVTMDGIAIPFDTFAAGTRSFPLCGIQAAGQPQLTLNTPNGALEVMTGATLPAGTNTVIRYEDLLIANNQATVVTDAIARGQNIHCTGTDRKAGDIIVAAGRRLSAAEIAIAATIGKASLRVLRFPRIAILSTGDELVSVDSNPLPHQIRMSNAYAIQALLQPWQSACSLIHLPDELEKSMELISQALHHHDILILSGGVSAGKFDFIPQAMQGLGVRTLFHQVAQRPGKPFWFGISSNQQAIFALPGNPVSAFAGTIRYILPFIKACAGLNPDPEAYAVLTEPFSFKPKLTYFLQVGIRYNQDGHILATPLSGKGSGDFANLSDADGFLELPADRDNFEQGEVFPLWRYR
jgi:molybdopterin molybdotransferase